ncbi:MAG: YbaB/EbfC family nucleoid-associated protein [Bacteroidota bacterium]|nr:YbaB/EbfC family nucleoid-associated protein [Bacteroidota bacterium]
MNINFQEVLERVQEMRSRMTQIQEKLATLVTEAEVGGGMVSVRANGKQEILSIKIDPSVVTKDDVPMLEDLVVSGVNKALERARALAQNEFQQAAAGILPDIPGLDPGALGLK